MALALFKRALVIVRGGGDLASGAIFRLFRAGFPVIVTELPTPLMVRRAVSYGDAVYSGMVEIEGVQARLVPGKDEARAALEAHVIPVLVDPDGEQAYALDYAVVVDARMAKVNLGTMLRDAPLVIALGPGFTAGVDCHAVIETNRGHRLGRVIWRGAAEPDTGIPGEVQNQTHSRVLRAPADGLVLANVTIGDTVEAGQVIAEVSGQPVVAAFNGVLRGLVHERVQVTSGMKIGDLDPRARRDHCFTISDKSLAVGGGVLEAILSAPQMRPYLDTCS
jgi:xanthine dehydrogenase accessory factor